MEDFLGMGMMWFFVTDIVQKIRIEKSHSWGVFFSLHKVTIFNFGIIIETFSGLMYKNVLDKVDRYESWYECEVQST